MMVEHPAADADGHNHQARKATVFDPNGRPESTSPREDSIRARPLRPDNVQSLILSPQTGRRSTNYSARHPLARHHTKPQRQDEPGAWAPGTPRRSYVTGSAEPAAMSTRESHTGIATVRSVSKAAPVSAVGDARARAAIA